MRAEDRPLISAVDSPTTAPSIQPPPDMESAHNLAPPHVDASRPSLGFPLGTALLLLIIFSLSGIFSCCYHWEKHRSLRRSLSAADIESSPSKPRPPVSDLKRNQRLSLPVLMPGDDTPKFIALPCPCEPPRPEDVPVNVQTAHTPPVKPPPRFPVPLL